MVVAAGTSVIKRAGHSQPYHESKLHASVVAACRSVRALEGEAEFIAGRVCNAVTDWISDKVEVTTRDIRTQAHLALAVHHLDAAYAYATLDSTL